MPEAWHGSSGVLIVALMDANCPQRNAFGGSSAAGRGCARAAGGRAGRSPRHGGAVGAEEQRA